jgi:cell division protein ZapE
MVALKYIYATRAAEGTIRPDPAQEAVLPELDRIRDELAAHAPKCGIFGRAPKTAPVKGLYLWGGVGRGKSYLMDLFVTHVSVPKRRVHFHAFMQEIHAGMTEARKRGVDDALAPVADKLVDELRLLAFDEMQITDITDAMIVGRLFQRLFDAGVTVVATSNRHPDALYKDGLNRALFLPFIDLIKDRMTVWELSGPTDYRQDRLAGEQTYFHPVDAAARAAVDAIWHDMTGAPRTRAAVGTEAATTAAARGVATQDGLTLRVKGRDVHLPRFRAGVARVSFWDLCGVPLGAADYLAVAEAVRVLILEDVPRLGISNFNEAKRFVTLVDALYEAGTRLIVTAADTPDRLYLEGAGAFEFERTASRLHEMQGADWGARADAVDSPGAAG